MKTTFAAFMLLATACGGAKYRCDPNCFKSITSDVRLDCRKVYFNVDLVIEAYESAGLQSSSLACKMLGNVDLIVRPEWEGWRYSGPLSKNESVSGATSFSVLGIKMEVSQDLESMTHESLHVYEKARGLNQDRPSHYGWDTNVRYQFIMDQYAARVCSQIPPNITVAAYYHDHDAWCSTLIRPSEWNP